MNGLESSKGENRIKENKAPWSIISKRINEPILAQPAYNTVYSDHAALVNDVRF